MKKYLYPLINFCLYGFCWLLSQIAYLMLAAIVFGLVCGPVFAICFYLLDWSLLGSIVSGTLFLFFVLGLFK